MTEPGADPRTRGVTTEQDDGAWLWIVDPDGGKRHPAIDRAELVEAIRQYAARHAVAIFDPRTPGHAAAAIAAKARVWKLLGLEPES